MTEISKIDVLKIDSKLLSRDKDKSTAIKDGKFEDQLLKTVKELESMGNEINAMMESSSLNHPTISNTKLNVNKHLEKSIESVVENFSAARKTSVKSAKSIAAHYEQMGKNKKS